ncbi:molybdopterin-synthase adenylyltransferase MoeB [Pseudofulvibacter geojedonensis]|uniref:Molybdopterin-synthase adenylyltransferase MoeB n=1 Tax=Pseudofulvibacter geojedonensis TaxID=1123758 RepID=A0ABW3I1G5_9FLAO
MFLSPEENNQYNRHLILDEIGESGQLKLKQARVLVIGAGGLGCPILQYLTAAGVGSIGVIDHDIIDQSNLQRQILYSHDDIGKFKAEVAANKLSGLNPFVEFEIYLQKVTSEIAIELFSRYDIIVDGSDNFPTRYLVNDAAVLTNKPVVFGSIFKFEGQVSVFNYQNGPTYRCLYPNPPKPNEVPNCSEIGVLGVLPGIIGSLQANEVLKMICGIGEVLSGKLLTYDALSMQQLVLGFEKNEAIVITQLDSDYDFFCGLPKSNLEITLKELEVSSEDYNLLDVREDYEHAQYNIGGQHIPLGQLHDRFTEISQEKDLVVYCKAGVRSKMAIDILKDKGFTKLLVNLKGGVFGY